MISIKRFIIISSIASSISVTGCRPMPALEHRFPIGLFKVNNPSELKEIKGSGFDSFHTDFLKPNDLEPLAEAASSLGMSMLVFPNDLRNLKTAKDTSHWPILAWYIDDEPDVEGLSFDQLNAIAAQTRQWDPKRPQAFSIGKGEKAKNYPDIGNVLMLDWYPIPHLNINSVGDEINAARKFLPQNKPLWMIVQALDWKDYPQRDPSKKRIGRFPTSTEIRYMSYLAVLHGARGLFYFTHTMPNGQTLLEYPERWQALSRVAKEMKRMRPIFVFGDGTGYNGKPNSEDLKIHIWNYQKKSYAVLLNKSSEKHAALPEAFLARQWRPLFERFRDVRKILTQNNSRWQLPPQHVLVLEGPLIPKGLSIE